MFEALKAWFLSLGPHYGVNPIVFGIIYVGAIPPFTACIAWLIKNLRRRKPITLPLLLGSLFFVSSYLYLIVVGRNIPAWVYGFVVVMLLFGIYSTFQTVKKQAGARLR